MIRASFHTSRKLLAALGLMVAALTLAGCSTVPNPNPRAGDEQKLANVDLPRYMGHWYIIANIPYWAERDYVGAQSEWRLRDDGKIADSYIGRKGGFDQPETRKELVDTPVPGTNNAQWHVQLFWPVYVSQLTLYVDPDYQYTILGYPDKSLGWIFSRTPDMSDEKYREMLARLDAAGYDTTRFKRIPQRPDQIGKPGFQSPGDPH